MPVKRRRSKARPESAKAWVMYMMAGHDYFDDLVDAGIVPAGEMPTRDFAAETWQRMGAEILDAMADLHIGFRPPERPIWAEEQFGPPPARRRHAH